MDTGNWIALSGVAAAFLAVAGQLFALRREHRIARQQARYDELERAYIAAAEAAGAPIDRLRLWAVTGALDERQALGDVGSIREAAGVLKMHQASEAAKAQLLQMAEAFQGLTVKITEGWRPEKPTAPELDRLEAMLFDYYSLAGAHLREVWPRPQSMN